MINSVATLLCSIVVFFKKDDYKATMLLGIISIVLYFSALIMCRPITTLLSALKSISPQLPPDVQAKNKQRIVLFLVVKFLLLTSVVATLVSGFFVKRYFILKGIHEIIATIMILFIAVQLVINLAILLKSKTKQ